MVDPAIDNINQREAVECTLVQMRKRSLVKTLIEAGGVEARISFILDRKGNPISFRTKSRLEFNQLEKELIESVHECPCWKPRICEGDTFDSMLHLQVKLGEVR
jgi:hypothetical protein